MKSRLAAFKHAFNGGRTLLVTQPHARCHAAVALIVFAAAAFYQVTVTEWIFLILCVMAVWITEAINTGLEFLADEVSLERRERIKHAKDISAFAVLTAAIGSSVIGAIIFLPYLSKK